MADGTCSECGTYVGHRPRVEFVRDPAACAWRAYIVEQPFDESARAMGIVIPDDKHRDWRVSPPQHLSATTDIFIP